MVCTCDPSKGWDATITTRPATTSEHPVPNLEPGDIVMLEDGREALVTARVETGGEGPFAALLEVVVALTPLASDDGVA